MRTPHRQRGFTLIEIIAVLMILGILAATAIPRYFNLQQDAQIKAATGAVAEAQSRINMAFSRYMLAGGQCAEFTGISLNTAYDKALLTGTLGIADADKTIGGWSLGDTKDTLLPGGELIITTFTPPGGVATATLANDANAPASLKAQFTVHVPSCSEE